MARVNPIPNGFTAVTPHLVCARAAEAIEFYKKAFGAVEESRLPGEDGKIMHAVIRINGAPIMLGEESLKHRAVSPKTLNGSPVTIHLYVDDTDAAVERAKKAGAKVTMPAQDQFWGDRYGTLEDPFGHHWSIATHVRDVSPKEMEEAMKKMEASHA
jgi:PhnB protein